MEKVKNFLSGWLELFKSNRGHMIFTIIATFILSGMIFSGGGGSGDAQTASDPSVDRTVSQSSVVSESNQPTESEDNVNEVTKYKHGMYKVGADLAAGEYVIVSDFSCYVEVAKDSTGTFDSIISNDNFINRHYISVSDGQYISFTDGYMVAVADAAPAEVNAEGRLDEGMYKVGFDIPAGEYKLSPTGSGYYAVLKDSKGTFDSIIANEIFEGDVYVTVSDGQYIKISDCTIKVK